MTTNGARDRPGGGGESPTTVPEHVATWPGWSDRKGTRRVRSSWRSGRKKSASSTVRHLREGPLGGSYDQPRAQADEATVAPQPRLDAGEARRNDPARARLHPVSQGGQGHQGHLSTGTNGRGRRPLPIGTWWEATTPHRRPATLTSSSFSSSPSSSSLLSPPIVLGFTAPAPSVAHRLATEVLGLLTPPPLVAQKVGVELWQTHHREPALLQQGVEDAGVVGREEVHGAVPFGCRAEPERGGDRGRVPFEVAVHGRHAEARGHQ